MTTLTKQKINLSEEQFKKIHTVSNIFKMQGAFTCALSKDEETAKLKDLVTQFEAKSIAAWPKTMQWNRATLNEKWNSIAGKSTMFMGDAFAYGELLQSILKEGDCYLEEKTVDGLVKVGNTVKVAVDLVKYKSQVTSLLSRVDKGRVAEAIIKQSSEADFWYIVMELLTEAATIELVGLLTARMLMPKESREALDRDLLTVDVLKNKQGKLAQSVLRLIGYVGLASVAGDPDMAQAIKFIKNPLLGEEPTDRVIVKRSDETAAAFKERQETHAAGFATYKAIMVEMKKHQAEYNKLPASTIASVKLSVKAWCGANLIN